MFGATQRSKPKSSPYSHRPVCSDVSSQTPYKDGVTWLTWAFNKRIGTSLVFIIIACWALLRSNRTHVVSQPVSDLSAFPLFVLHYESHINWKFYPASHCSTLRLADTTSFCLPNPQGPLVTPPSGCSDSPLITLALPTAFSGASLGPSPVHPPRWHSDLPRHGDSIASSHPLAYNHGASPGI